jgi:hypothetical protein
MMAKQIILGMGEDFLRKEGLLKNVELWEDGFRTHPDRKEFEWWYFDAHLNDGSTIVVVFLTKGLLNPNAPFEPQVTLTITTPDGRKIFRVIKSLPERFSAARDRCDIHIAGCHVHGDLRKYHLHIDAPMAGMEPEIQMDLDLQATVEAWRPGAGKNYYDKKRTRYFAWLAAVPFGRVKGRLSIAGKKSNISGAGYHDHNWGSVALPTVLSRWVWGRASVDGFNLIFVEMVPLRKYGKLKLPVFFLARGRKILVEDGRPLQVKKSNYFRHASGRKYPRDLCFTWQEGENKVVVKLSDVKIIEATSLLNALPNWQRNLTRIIINPYYLRFISCMEMQINMGKIQDQVKGNALFEWMFLR